MSALIRITPPAALVFVGLGQMGQPMVKCLRDAGFRVLGVDPAPAARNAVGGEVYETLQSACNAAEVAAIITMLPNGRVVQQVLLKGGEPLACIRKAALIIDMSSSAPNDTVALHGQLSNAGIALIDAPVSGGVRKATTGELSIICGGKAHSVDAAMPVLDAMGAAVFHVGPIGAGHAMKALNNFVSAAGFAAASEAMLIGKAFDIDPNVLVDVLNASTGRNNSTEVKMKQQVVSEDFASGFSLALMAKDLGTARDLSNDLGLASPVLAQVTDLWGAASDDLGQGADHTEYFRFTRDQMKES
ncbi:MAG: NAD(P)-dependent oxidoreductase [Rhodobacteraceae bacterium]|nr:NAD(P)-dependent oxidoreductase [Paracoccaceae bacterium]